MPAEVATYAPIVISFLALACGGPGCQLRLSVGKCAAAFAVALVACASIAHADALTGRASVIDGDTLEIHGEHIRVLDIDAPEAQQTCADQHGAEWRCGQRAALALSDWIGWQTVACNTAGKDRYGRWLARCTVAGADMGEWLAANGWVVPYRDCHCEMIRDAAQRAKAAQLGIWSGSFMLPWEWRKNH